MANLGSGKTRTFSWHLLYPFHPLIVLDIHFSEHQSTYSWPSLASLVDFWRVKHRGSPAKRRARRDSPCCQPTGELEDSVGAVVKVEGQVAHWFQKARHPPRRLTSSIV